MTLNRRNVTFGLGATLALGACNGIGSGGDARIDARVDQTLARLYSDYPATRVAIWMWRHLRPFGIDLLDPQTHYGRGALWPMIERFGSVFGLRSILAKRPSLTDSAAFWSAMISSTGRPLALEAAAKPPFRRFVSILPGNRLFMVTLLPA